jgi:hypothetical protein
MNAPRRLVPAALALALGLVLAPGLSAQAPAPPAPSAASTAQETPAEAPRKKKPRRSSNVLTTEEIQDAASSHSDAYSLVQSQRPGWFQKRGVSSINRSENVRVYVDGMSMGGVGELRRLNSTYITSMEHLDGTTATQRFGTDHGAGAILVRTRN